MSCLPHPPPCHLAQALPHFDGSRLYALLPSGRGTQNGLSPLPRRSPPHTPASTPARIMQRGRSPLRSPHTCRVPPAPPRAPPLCRIRSGRGVCRRRRVVPPAQTTAGAAPRRPFRPSPSLFAYLCDARRARAAGPSPRAPLLPGPFAVLKGDDPGGAGCMDLVTPCAHLRYGSMIS